MCVVLPGTVVTDKQLTMMMSSSAEQAAGGVKGGEGKNMGKPQMGNSVTALFALTDCLQVWELYVVGLAFAVGSRGFD